MLVKGKDQTHKVGNLLEDDTFFPCVFTFSGLVFFFFFKNNLNKKKPF